MSKKNCDKLCRKTSIGGQALMEGIMMRGPEKSAMAVRRPNGEIFFEEVEIQKKKRPAICRWPLIRGVFGFVDSMAIGYKALMRSADIFVEEVEEETTEEAVADPAPQNEQPAEQEAQKTEPSAKEPKKMFSDTAMTVMMVISVVLAVALFLGLFLWLPSFLHDQVLEKYLSFWPKGNRFEKSVTEAVMRVILLVLYMASMLFMKDIRRTFMYHGAEHKTIFCYEKGVPLTVENVKKQQRFHPRCGTSFLVLMMLVGILVGFLIPASFEGVSPKLYTFIRTGIKVLLIPLNMGLGYELLKFAGRHENIVTRIISAPGMWLQHITVLEPTDDMIECAIRAFLAVLPEEEKEKETLAATGGQAQVSE